MDELKFVNRMIGETLCTINSVTDEEFQEEINLNWNEVITELDEALKKDLKDDYYKLTLLDVLHILEIAGNEDSDE